MAGPFNCLPFIFCVLSLLLVNNLLAVSAIDCPTKDQLEDNNGEPLITQLSPTQIQLDWTDLWTDFEWYACFIYIKVVKETDGGDATEDDTENQFEVRDVNQKTLEITVTPCEEVRFAVRAELLENEGQAQSYFSKRRFKSFAEPLGKTIDATLFKYHKDPDSGVLDLTRVDIDVDFDDVVEDPSCRRVVGTELRLRKEGEEVWTVVENTKTFRNLKMTVDGLDEICSSYEIGLQLLGTEGTDGSLVTLARIDPVTRALFQTALDTGFQYRLPEPQGFTTQPGLTHVKLSWVYPSCINVYHVIVTKVGDTEEEEENVYSSEQFTASELMLDSEKVTECQTYKIRLASTYEFQAEGDAGGTS